MLAGGDAGVAEEVIGSQNVADRALKVCTVDSTKLPAAV